MTRGAQAFPGVVEPVERGADHCPGSYKLGVDLAPHGLDLLCCLFVHESVLPNFPIGERRVVELEHGVLFLRAEGSQRPPRVHEHDLRNSVKVDGHPLEQRCQLRSKISPSLGFIPHQLPFGGGRRLPSSLTRIFRVGVGLPESAGSRQAILERPKRLFLRLHCGAQLRAPHAVPGDEPQDLAVEEVLEGLARGGDRPRAPRPRARRPLRALQPPREQLVRQEPPPRGPRGHPAAGTGPPGGPPATPSAPAPAPLPPPRPPSRAPPPPPSALLAPSGRPPPQPARAVKPPARGADGGRPTRACAGTGNTCR